MATNPFDLLGSSASSPFQGPGFDDPFNKIGTGQDNYTPVQPPAPAQSQQPQGPQPTYNQGLRRAYATQNPFSSGILSGVKGLEAGYYGLKGKAEAALGSTDWATQALQKSQQINQQAADYTPEGAGTYNEAFKNNKVGSYLLHQIGNVVPTAAGAVAAGALTGGAADIAGLGAGAAEASQAAALTGYGAAAGAGGGASDVLNSKQGTLQSRALKSLGGDVANGAIQAVPGLGLLNRFGLSAAAADGVEQAVGRPLFQRLLVGAAKQGALGAGANAASAVTEGAVHNWVTGEGKDLMSPEAMSEYLNAAASGFVGGAVLGGAGEAVTGRGPTTENVSKVQQTINSLREKMGKQPLREVPPEATAQPTAPEAAQPPPLDAPQAEQDAWAAKAQARGYREVLPDTDSTFNDHLQTLKESRPYDVTQADPNDPASPLYLSSKGTPTTARLTDPDRLASFQGGAGEMLGLDKLPNGKIDPLQAAAASMLPDEAAAGGADIKPGIKAFADAVSKGYSSLDDEQTGHLSDYLEQISADPDKYNNAMRMLATTDSLAKEGKLDQLDLNRSDNTPAVETQAPVAAETLLSSKDWNQARSVGKNRAPSNQEAMFGDTPHDMTQLSAAIAKSPDMDLGANAVDRRRNAVMYAAQEGETAGRPLHPDSIRPGLKVFNGDNGTLSPSDAAFIRKQLAQRGNERGLTPPEESASDTVPRANPKAPFQAEESGAKERHLGEGDFDTPDSSEALKPTTTSEADERLARSAASRMNINARQPLEDMYRQAKRFKDSPARTALLGAVRRVADGNEELTNKLDAVDGRTTPADNTPVPVRAYTGHDENAPLARASDSQDGVLESVRKAMQTPEYKAIAKDLSDVRGTRFGDEHVKDLQGVLNKLSKGFGVPNLELRTHTKGDTFETQPGVVHDNVNGAYHPREHWISLQRGMKPEKAVSTMLHEFGHHMEETLYDHLPSDSPIRSDIEAAYNDWADERINKAKDETIGEARANRAPIFRTIGEAERGDRSSPMTKGGAEAGYATSRAEYFADMTARALYEHEPLNGALREAGGFFQRVGHAMRTLYSFFQKVNPKATDAPEAFRKFVRDTWTGEDSPVPHTTMVEDAAHDDQRANGGSSFTEGNGNAPPGQGGGGGTPGEGNGGQPGEISHLLNNYDRKTLYHMLVRPDIMKQMVEHANEHMSPYDVDQFEKAIYRNDGQGMNAVVNYGAKLFNEGSLRTSEQNVIGALRRFKQNAADAIGLKTSDREATRVLKDAQKGQYYGPGSADQTDTRTRTERELQAGLLRKIGQATREGDTGKAAVYKTQLAARKTLAKAELFYENKLLPVRNAAMVNLNRRLREVGSPAAMTLAHTLDRITGERGEQSMSSAIQQKVTQHFNRFAETIDGLNDSQKSAMLRALRTQTETTDPAVQKAMGSWYSHAKDVENYLRASGKTIGHVEKYWPVVLDPKLVTADGGQAFKAMLSDPRISDDMLRSYYRDLGVRSGSKPSVAQANSEAMSREDMVNGFYSMAAHSPDVYAHGEALEDGGVPLQPGGAQFHPRVSSFLFQNKEAFPDLLDQFANFQSKDLAQTALPYLKRAVKVAEFHRRFIDPYSGANKLNDIFEQAQRDGTTESQQKLMRDSVDAALGNLGRGRSGPMDKAFKAIDQNFGTNWAEKGPTAWQEAQKYLITYQNLRTMALGAFGSVIDPLGAWTRSSNLRDAVAGYKTALGKGDSAQFFRDQAEMLGIIKRHGMSDLVASMYGDGSSPTGVTGKINNALFRYNGQEALSNFSRRMALATAHRFLLRHAQGYNEHSSRYLAELGLAPSDIQAHPTQLGAVDFSNPKVAKALYQFVEESVINPRPTQRTGWMNDPNFAVAAQYKNFMYAFYDTIAERIEHEVINGNYHALAPAAGYLGVALASELAKEMVQYGPGGNPNHADWGPKEYLEQAAMRSGLVEPEDQLDYESAMNTFGGTAIPYESLAGPSAEQLHGVLRATLGNGSMTNTVESALPLETVYRGWFN